MERCDNVPTFGSTLTIVASLPGVIQNQNFYSERTSTSVVRVSFHFGVQPSTFEPGGNPDPLISLPCQSELKLGFFYDQSTLAGCSDREDAGRNRGPFG
jgi:hypothetical protein